MLMPGWLEEKKYTFAFNSFHHFETLQHASEDNKAWLVKVSVYAHELYTQSSCCTELNNVMTL